MMKTLVKSLALLGIIVGLAASVQAGAGLADEGNKCGRKANVGDTWPISVYGSQGLCKVKTLDVMSGVGTYMGGPECGEVTGIAHITGPCGEWSKGSDKDE